MAILDLDLKKLRNIGFAAHIDAGKTTTTERILFYTRKIYKMGEVDEGSATMDWMPQEQERGITITSAVTSCQWRGYLINIIDTPGHVDFTVEVERSLRVLDGIIIIFCAVGAVQPQSETVSRQADKYRIPRLAYVNKMDRIGADLHRVIEGMRNKLNTNPVMLQVPIGQEENFKGIIDIIKQKAVYFEGDFGENVRETEIPEEFLDQVKKHRELLFEKLAENDEEFMEKYLYGKVEYKDIISALRRTTLSYAVVPVLLGSSLKNKGAQLLLDKIIELLPSPLDIPAVEGMDLDEKSQKRFPNYEDPFSALAFKITFDPHMGKLTYIRVYSGQFKRGQAVYNSVKDRKERISKILRMHANRREEIEEIGAGDLGALAGLKFTNTGDTLCDKGKPVILENIKFPEPVISIAIEPKTKADQDKMSDALSKLLEEDPTFRLKNDEETGQTIISGMGELHLEIIIDRLFREYKLSANIGKPQVAYKEAIRISAEAEGKYFHQFGARGQYGHVVVRLKPAEPLRGFKFVNEVSGEVIPKDFILSAEKGIKETLETGILAGYPVIDVKAELIGGSFNEVDSTELAYEVAASMAVKEALRKADVYLKEPLMKVEVITPEEYMGEIIGDLNSRRGRIENMKTSISKTQIISALVPLAELFGYATDLRSLSQGRATYNMEFYTYQELPKHISEDILNRIYGGKY